MNIQIRQPRLTTKFAFVGGVAFATLARFGSAVAQKSQSGDPVVGKQLD